MGRSQIWGGYLGVPGSYGLLGTYPKDLGAIWGLFGRFLGIWGLFGRFLGIWGLFGRFLGIWGLFETPQGFEGIGDPGIWGYLGYFP